MNLLRTLLLIIPIGFCHAGQITMLDPTPPEMMGIGVTYEKIGFTFEEPVSGRFWVEYDGGDGKKLQTMEVPRDHAVHMRKYTLIYVQTSYEVTLTAVTESEFPLNRRGCSFGSENSNGSRDVIYRITSLNVPLGEDITLYTARIKAGYRHPDIPDKLYRVMAHFDKP